MYNDLVSEFSDKESVLPRKDKSLVRSPDDVHKQFQEKYIKLIKPYKDIGIEEYRNHGKDFWDDSPRNFPDAHWKFHLNVLPENVRTVSEFLKRHNFHHKYLSGGEIESGKIFTVYTGSKKLTEFAVRVISSNVGNLLTDPKAEGEVLFAPNIVGRFEGSPNNFDVKACKNGISIAKERRSFPLKISEEDVLYSKNKLISLYGDYFGGGISFFDPEK